jgi:hypothetical protein
MDIIESNKVIAEFLGYNVVDKPKVVNGENFFEYFDEEKGYSICGTSLKFHYSWNHLMPVIARLTSLVPIEISQGITPFMLLDNIGRVHAEVVEIIEWHNQRWLK